VGDKPGEKKYGCCCFRVKWIVEIGVVVKKIPDMIQRHDDHDDTPEKVNRTNPGPANRGWLHKQLIDTTN
jgi:hypothetical protein